jgi:ATP-dependent Lhr-like helicase
VLGEVEEYFIEGLTHGDTFVFSGEIVRFEALMEDEAYVSRAHAEDPKVPAYMGGKFPLSTYLAARVRALISQPSAWQALPAQVRELARHPAKALARADAGRTSGRDHCCPVKC